MKLILSILTVLLLSPSAFALDCKSVFVEQEKTDRALLNSLKRIRNYGTFKSIMLVHEKSQRMTLVVFDILNDGIIGERKSIDDHVQELREFGSQIRYVYDSATQHHILTSRLVKLPSANRNENLLNLKYKTPIDLLENLRKSKSPQESYEYEVFQSFQRWLSLPGPQLNVVLIPISMQKSFVENMANSGDFKARTLDSLIETIDPINSK